jgi:hypothetical protein
VSDDFTFIVVPPWLVGTIVITAAVLVALLARR